MVTRIQIVVLADLLHRRVRDQGCPAREILYVSNGDNTIVKFTSDGGGSVFASSGLNFPIGVPLIAGAISTRQTATTRLRSSLAAAAARSLPAPARATHAACL